MIGDGRTQRGSAMVRRFSWVGLILVVVLAALAASGASIAATRDTGLGRRLVNRFFLELKRHDVAGLRRFLSPAFQIQRADGSRLTKSQYLHNLPTVSGYTLRDLRTSSSRKMVVVTYQARTDEVIDGKKYRAGYAPRISVFSSGTRGWQIVAHGNFNTPA